jgi:hypothetical protein
MIQYLQESRTFDEEDTYNIVELQELYDLLLDDWRDKYYSVDDETRTPIAFVIEPYESSVINYTMVVCYGEIDLDEYSDENFLVPGTIRYDVAAQMLENRMFNHLNNPDITYPFRSFYTALGYHWEEPDLNNPPPFPLNVNDPTSGDQYIDYLFWFIDKSLPSGYHFLLHDWEYDYHESAYFNFVNDFIVSMPGANACSFSHIGIDITGIYNPFGSPPVFPDKMWHEPLIVYGVWHYTSSNLSTL